ncbi:MAG: 4Fe-4S ferredoxin [Atopobiaceae bacterium]|nr:4Fe-4S ferredoxin [Atopobiaceae bacterium]MCI2174113.1 4Fe-4S ferredoxin [Atopobiaceae bacterium]MCI2206754.1 4Fe-4S ferredoxin [Atopobiaceae bacterium]
MAQKRDLLDDIIDIQGDWKAISDPLGNLANALTDEPGTTPTWNPADYKERPRANTIPCISCQARDASLCTKCADVCPVGAIEIDEGSIEIADTCRKCGLCATVCEEECFVTQKTGPKKLYDRIASAAESHESAYVTCTRALGRMPADNEVVLPCVAAVPAEVWFALVTDYHNISVYLPLGICDKCRTKGGEDAYVREIGQAEEWSGSSVGLEVDEGQLDHEMRRSWQRKDFLNSMVQTGSQLVGRVNPVAAAVTAVTKRLDQHTKQINDLEVALDKACGTTTSRRRRVLTQRRQLLLTALQKHPRLAPNVAATRPVCDGTACTLCGDCVKACPTHDIDLTEDGLFKAEADYCIDCGACLSACAAHALSMEEVAGSELVVADETAEERAKKSAEQKAEVERLKAEGKKQLNRGLDFLEGLDDGQ